MSYIELYKKLRPRKWSDVIGQDTTVKELKNMVAKKRLPTGLAFFGGPGTGKTTVAKILAKTLNCNNVNDNLEPCNECATCKAIDNDSQLGVQYISMSENGNVDYVRTLVNEARLSQPVKQQVFILDEFHSASLQALESLLIPIESEKMNTLFIFCSTESQKIPSAILSRLQSFTFVPVNAKVLAIHLMKINQAENLGVTPETILNCVKSSKGSVRTAIVKLEQASNGAESDISYSSKIEDELLNGSVLGIITLCREMKENSQSFVKTLDVIYRDFSNALEEKFGVDTGNLDSKKLSKLPEGIIITSISIIGETLSKINARLLDNETVVQIPLVKIAMGINQYNTKKEQ